NGTKEDPKEGQKQRKGRKHQPEVPDGFKFFDLDGSGKIEEGEAVLVRLLLGPDLSSPTFEDAFYELLDRAFEADTDPNGSFSASMWRPHTTGSLFEIGAPRPEEPNRDPDATVPSYSQPTA
ncbi:hypothetical protein FOZ63_024255, partial [Perkinsus olseni]